jgi:hypothetical protein
MTHSPGLLVLLAGLAIAAPLSARPLEKELPPGKDICWERRYDAAHLAAHPGQRVTAIRLVSQGDSPGAGTPVVTLLFTLRARKAGGDPADFDYQNLPFCKGAGAGLACENEYGLGRFRIERAARGGLLIRNPGIMANPYPYDAEEIADGAVRIPSRPDDSAWIVDRIVTEKCPF